MNSGVTRMIKILFIILIMVHIMACAWFLEAKFKNFEPDTWVAYHKLEDEGNNILYLYSIYWVLQTLTTVGFGDIPPQSDTERIFCIIWMMIGIGFYSFNIGNLSSMISSIDQNAAILDNQLKILEDYSKRNKLSEELQMKIKNFLELNKDEHMNQIDQKELFNQLPANLRTEIIFHINEEIIKRLQFFQGKETEIIWSVLPLLKPMTVFKKNVLYNEGDRADETYFIFKGRVRLYFNAAQGKGEVHNMPLNIYIEGSYFGETEVLLSQGKQERLGTAVADCECQLLIIKKNELQDLLGRFSDIKQEMMENAKEKKKKQLIKKYNGEQESEEENQQDNIAKVEKLIQEHENQLKLTKIKSEQPPHQNFDQQVIDQVKIRSNSNDKRYKNNNLEVQNEDLLNQNQQQQMKKIDIQIGPFSTQSNQIKKKKARRNIETNNSNMSSKCDDDFMGIMNLTKISSQRKKEENKHVTFQFKTLKDFVDNMSLITLNSQEFIKIYKSIQTDYQDINSQISFLESTNKDISEKLSEFQEQCSLIQAQL